MDFEKLAERLVAYKEAAKKSGKDSPDYSLSRAVTNPAFSAVTGLAQGGPLGAAIGLGTGFLDRATYRGRLRHRAAKGVKGSGTEAKLIKQLREKGVKSDSLDTLGAALRNTPANAALGGLAGLGLGIGGARALEGLKKVDADTLRGNRWNQATPAEINRIKARQGLLKKLTTKGGKRALIAGSAALGAGVLGLRKALGNTIQSRAMAGHVNQRRKGYSHGRLTTKAHRKMVDRLAGKKS